MTSTLQLPFSGPQLSHLQMDGILGELLREQAEASLASGKISKVLLSLLHFALLKDYLVSKKHPKKTNSFSLKPFLAEGIFPL